MDELKDINEPSRNLKTETISTNTLEHNSSLHQNVESKGNLEASATVKFVLMPLGQVITLAKPLTTRISDFLIQFSNDLKIESDYLQIIHSVTKSIVDPKISLKELNVEANGIVQLEVFSTDTANHPIKPYKTKDEFFNSPDVITVRVDLDQNQYKEVVVEIERSNIRKSYLGGFRHKQTGQQFFNAASQTRKPPRPDNGIEKFCRDTQTVVSHHLKMQTYNDMATQMTKPGVFVSTKFDKLVEPKTYETADEREKKIIKNVIIIQKYYRRWLAKKQFQEIQDAFIRRMEWEKEQELLRIQEIEKRRQNDINRRLNPKTKNDFEILYAALEKWRMEEVSKINATKSGAARKAALALLLDQEAELIATIERYKIEASKENKEKQIQYLLDQMSSPKRWKYKDGTTTEVDTPYNIRAKELKDIYNSLNMKYLTQDERLDVLLTLKHTVKEHDCKLTQEIISLIDREADLLMRGIKEESLVGLRKRITTLFLQYVKTPQFNPAVSKHLKVPLEITDVTKENYYCSTCEKYMPSTEFPVSTTSTKVGKCRNCKHLENVAIKRTDFTKYKYLLVKIQHEEEVYAQDSRVCFLLNERDIQYIFENIWASQSILSSINDVYQLHFVRWNKQEEWSPWNCILLTLEEASAHLKLNELEANYGDTFIRKVKQKHTVAKNYFSKLPGISEYMRKLELRGDIYFPPLAGVAISQK